MNRADDPVRQRLVHQVLGARTLPTIAEASQALRHWMQEHPDDQGMCDGFEALAMIQQVEEWKLANPEEWEAEQEAERRAIAAHQPERERMLRDALRARTKAHLDRAEQELFQWIRDYPEDVGRELGIVEALEQVVTRQAALATQEQPVLAGRAA